MMCACASTLAARHLPRPSGLHPPTIVMVVVKPQMTEQLIDILVLPVHKMAGIMPERRQIVNRVAPFAQHPRSARRRRANWHSSARCLLADSGDSPLSPRGL